MQHARPCPLTLAEHIGFVGDLHGDLGALLAAARSLRGLGVDIGIAAGDFGFVWPGVNYKRTLDKISNRLQDLDFTLYFVDGNHEWFPELSTYPVGEGGQRIIRENVIHLPRGYRTALSSGRMLAALGGANSIDRDERREGVDWWPEEAIGDEDLVSLGHGHADLMVGHDAPLRVPSLDWALAANELGLSEEMQGYSLAGRRTFHRGFSAVRPELYIGGHYHQFIDEIVDFDDWSSTFRTRILLLDEVSPGTQSTAIVDSSTLEVVVLGLNHLPSAKTKGAN